MPDPGGRDHVGDLRPLAGDACSSPGDLICVHARELVDGDLFMNGETVLSVRSDARSGVVVVVTDSGHTVELPTDARVTLAYRESRLTPCAD